MADVTILLGDAREQLKTLPDCSVQCCVTSPPYYGLRDYGVAGQIGLEPTPDAYIAELVAVFREVRRVLRDDGVMFLNLGDSYARTGGAHNWGSYDGGVGRGPAIERAQKAPAGTKSGDLMGIPWAVAFALRSDGWYLRSDIIWAKPNPMPESVTNRPTSAHEHVFLLTKTARYFWDAEAVKETAVCPRTRGPALHGDNRNTNGNGGLSLCEPTGFRTLRNVWTIATRSYKGAHFATFPPALAETCIKAGTSEGGRCAACGSPRSRIVERAARPYSAPSTLDRFGDGSSGAHRTTGGQYQKWLDTNPAQTLGWRPRCQCESETVPCVVLDPFGGAGTTGLVAGQLGRDAILIELQPDYAPLIEERLGLPFTFASVLVRNRLARIALAKAIDGYTGTVDA